MKGLPIKIRGHNSVGYKNFHKWSYDKCIYEEMKYGGLVNRVT